MALEHKDRVAGLITDSTKQVFETMIGMEVHPGEPYLERNDPGPTEGVVSLVGLVGSWVGTGSFMCSPAIACRLASAMLMTDYSAVNQDVLDAVAEIANMIVGNIKTGIEEDLGPMGLSIPTVIYGRNFMTRSVGNSAWVVVPFLLNGERFEVQICLAPHRNGQTVPRFWMAGIHS